MSDYDPRNESYDCAECGIELPLDQLACFGEGVYYCDECAEQLLIEDEDEDGGEVEDYLDDLRNEL